MEHDEDLIEWVLSREDMKRLDEYIENGRQGPYPEAEMIPA